MGHASFAMRSTCACRTGIEEGFPGFPSWMEQWSYILCQLEHKKSDRSVHRQLSSVPTLCDAFIPSIWHGDGHLTEERESLWRQSPKIINVSSKSLLKSSRGRADSTSWAQRNLELSFFRKLESEKHDYWFFYYVVVYNNSKTKKSWH